MEAVQILLEQFLPPWQSWKLSTGLLNVGQMLYHWATFPPQIPLFGKLQTGISGTGQGSVPLAFPL